MTRDYLKLSVNPIVHQVNVSYSHPFRYLDALQQVPQVRSDLSNHLISKQTIPEKNLLKVPYRKNNAFRRKSSVRLRSGMLITFLHIIHLQIWLNRNILQNFICFFFQQAKIYLLICIKLQPHVLCSKHQEGCQQESLDLHYHEILV